MCLRWGDLYGFWLQTYFDGTALVQCLMPLTFTLKQCSSNMTSCLINSPWRCLDITDVSVPQIIICKLQNCILDGNSKLASTNILTKDLKLISCWFIRSIKKVFCCLSSSCTVVNVRDSSSCWAFFGRMLIDVDWYDSNSNSKTLYPQCLSRMLRSGGLVRKSGGLSWSLGLMVDSCCWGGS